MSKVKYGLSKLYYAVVTATEGVVTYGTPVAIPGAVTLSLSAEGEETQFFADNMAYYTAYSNNGYTGDLEVALLPDDFYVDVLGWIKNEDDVLIEPVSAVSNNVALLWQFEGDVNATRHVTYNVSVSRPGLDGKTTEKSKDPTADKISITATPAEDTGYVKAKAHATSAAYAVWYDEVYVGSEA